MRRWGVLAVSVVAASVWGGLLSGCTLTQREPVAETSVPQAVTATLSEQGLAQLNAVTQAVTAPGVMLPSVTASPVAVLPATATPVGGTLDVTVPPTPVPTVVSIVMPTAVAVLPSVTALPNAPPPSATPVPNTPLPSATPVPSTPLPSATATTAPTVPTETVPAATATSVIPPTFTPLPTLSPTPVPTRTLPGPTALPALDDGSGNTITGTGSDTLINPVAGITALPATLYYLSDVGDLVQVFRLRIGLNHPDQLTYSTTGVQAFSVAVDGTLAYITPGGALTIGGIPVVQNVNTDGTVAQVTALAWAPGGEWLAYVVSTPGAAEQASGGASVVSAVDGVWMRNREGTVVQLAANVYGGGAEGRIYSAPLRWRVGGEELMIKTALAASTPFTALDITSSRITPLWNDLMLLPELYTDARWNVNDNAIITGGAAQVLRVDPGTLNVTILLDESIGLVAESADQWVDGTVTFAGRAADGAVRLYRLAAGTSTPSALTDVLTTNGRIDFLWDDELSEVLLAVYDTPDQVLGAAYWRGTDGTLYDLAPLTGAVGAPVWGPVFQRSDWAWIRTTDGEALNVRATPSLQGEVLIRLVGGSRVAIIGGPRVADGYRWWQIRATDGAAGWAVESVLDERGLVMRTLIPVD